MLFCVGPDWNFTLILTEFLNSCWIDSHEMFVHGHRKLKPNDSDFLAFPLLWGWLFIGLKCHDYWINCQEPGTNIYASLRIFGLIWTRVAEIWIFWMILYIHTSLPHHDVNFIVCYLWESDQCVNSSFCLNSTYSLDLFKKLSKVKNVRRF